MTWNSEGRVTKLLPILTTTHEKKEETMTQFRFFALLFSSRPQNTQPPPLLSFWPPSTFERCPKKEVYKFAPVFVIRTQT